MGAGWAAVFEGSRVGQVTVDSNGLRSSSSVMRPVKYRSKFF